MEAMSSTGVEQRKLNVMVIFAHPDEGEIYAGGTAALYARMGHEVKFSLAHQRGCRILLHKARRPCKASLSGSDGRKKDSGAVGVRDLR